MKFPNSLLKVVVQEEDCFKSHKQKLLRQEGFVRELQRKRKSRLSKSMKRTKQNIYQNTCSDTGGWMIRIPMHSIKVSSNNSNELFLSRVLDVENNENKLFLFFAWFIYVKFFTPIVFDVLHIKVYFTSWCILRVL